MLALLTLLVLSADSAEPHPDMLSRDALVVRGHAEHPCVSLTQDDVARAQDNAGKYAWAARERDAIIESANRWLAHDEAYWLGYLPEPGACYAYGFTGCPICGGSTGTWAGARCTWDNPGHVRCPNGHTLPDAEHPDTGEGYTAPDGRIHYFAGQYNAWVTEQWTTKALPMLSQAYLLTGDEKYAARAALLLDAMASIYAESTSGSWDYPSNPPSGRFARPWYQVARTLVMYVDAYDAIYNSAALRQPSLRAGVDRRENIEQFMLMDGAYYCYSNSFGGVLHNGHADYMRGALAVGCLLDVPEFVHIAVEGSYSIHAMLANNIDRDGRYYESALGYAIHARLLYLTFADPLLNLRSAEYPEGVNLYDDAKFRSCMLLPEAQVLLAGRTPNFGDAAPYTTYEPIPDRVAPAVDAYFLERLYAKTSDEVFRNECATALRWLAEEDVEQLRDASKYKGWLLWHAEEVPSGKAALPETLRQRMNDSWIADMKGMAILRAGDQAALVRYGPSLNHGDPDDLALQYYANGYELTYDLGYGLGSTHTHVGWASSTISHAVVTVNETNQLKGEGSGGSLLSFASLPNVTMVEATSENSYSSENVREYRRAVALTAAGYLVDRFHVAGGNRHDYSFGSIGTNLTAVDGDFADKREGSLAEDVAWGQMIGEDGDIKGYPNKPYWNPPPGNGYGFFYNVREGLPHWPIKAEWRIEGEVPTVLRLHLLGEEAHPIFADAPGLYPNKPESSYVIARRTGEDLSSTFFAVYEPGVAEEDPDGSVRNTAVRLERVEQCGDNAVSVWRKDGTQDLLIFGSARIERPETSIEFKGDFAYLTGKDWTFLTAETVGCERLLVDGEELLSGQLFVADVVSVDDDSQTVTLDKDVPVDSAGQVAVFSSPRYSRTTAYHVASNDGKDLSLRASTLSLGMGRVSAVPDAQTVLSDVPHEYAKSVSRISSRFFDGKVIAAEDGRTARITNVEPGAPLVLHVDDATVFQAGDRFIYRDIVPGDKVRIALTAAVTLE